MFPSRYRHSPTQPSVKTVTNLVRLDGRKQVPFMLYAPVTQRNVVPFYSQELISFSIPKRLAYR